MPIHKAELPGVGALNALGDLLVPADECSQLALQRLTRQLWYGLPADNFAFQVAGGGLNTEMQPKLITLASRQHRARELRGLAKADRQHPARQRIEASAMPRFAGTEYALHLLQGRVRA